VFYVYNLCLTYCRNIAKITPMSAKSTL